MILAIRTDQAEAELSLIKDGSVVDRRSWPAYRTLSDSLLQNIDDLLASQQVGKADLKGIVVFQGPGSFTGLRIGITVANALAYGLKLPVVGASDPDWLESGLAGLSQASSRPVLPFYGAEPHLTQPRK